MKATNDYWEECVSAAFDDHGIVATSEQINNVADDVRVAHENYGMAFGYDAIPNPVETQAQRELCELKTEIRKKEDWICSTKPCRTCITKGSVHDVWGRDMTCPDCDGKGRV